MLFKIYFKNKPLYLTDKIEGALIPLSKNNNTIIIDELNSFAIEKALHEINESNVQVVILINSDLTELKNAFWEKFVPIQAAGGLVSDQDGNFLMMFRRNKWDLPKGKVEVNEDVKSAAEREVKEETGISQLETGELLTITYHTYDDWGDPMLKETYWYSMKASSEELLVPQTEEDITEVGFYKPEQIKIHCLNTFPSILDVLIKGKLL